MIDLEFARAGVNPELLHAELIAAGAEQHGFVGVSTGPYGVRVHFDRPQVGPAIREAVEAAVTNHDPAGETPAQAKRRQRREYAERMRVTPWAEWTAADKDRLLHWLAVQAGVLDDFE